MQFKLKNNLKFGRLREQLQSINKIPLNRIKQGLNNPKTPSNDVICYEGAANYVALFHKDGKDCDYVLGGGYNNILHAWAECDGKKYETRKPLNMKEEYVEYIRINIPKDLPIDDMVNKVVSTIKEKVDNKCLSEMYRGDKMKFTKPLDLDEALGLKKPLKESLDVESKLESLPHVNQVIELGKNTYKLDTKWVKTERQAHTIYLDIVKAAKREFGDSLKSLTYIDNEWRDNQAEVHCLLRVVVIEKELKEGNDPYHNHIQYKVTLKDEDGTYAEIFEVPEYVAIQDKKFDAKEYFKDFYKLKDDEIVKVEKVGYYTDSTNVNPFKYGESLKEDSKESRFIVVDRRALDGKRWWVAYDKKEKNYAKFPAYLGKYATKKECQYAIDKFVKEHPEYAYIEESLKESINTSKKPLKKALFTIEDEINVEGYDEDYSWNGWACPWFTKENADKIATWSSLPLEYDAKRDAYIEKDLDSGEIAYVGEHVDTEDGTLLLYPIGNKSWVWSIVEKPIVENKKKVCESLDDREEHFTKEEQEDYGIDENGYELDGFDRYIHCDWCGEPILEDETRKEINLGYLCKDCVDALISRGEKPVFDDYGAFDEELNEDWTFNVYSREGGLEKIVAKDDKAAKREYQKKHPTVALPFISIKTFGKVNETLNEEASNKDWTKIFEDALDTMEFTLIKYPDGWGLLDRQGGNLGDIEADRFENAEQIIDRLDAYWNDYYFTSIEEDVDEEDYPESGLYTAQDILNWYTPEMQKKYPDIASDIDVIELVANHFDDIELEKVYHENGNEDTVGTAVYEIHYNNDEKKDGRMYVQGKIYAVRCSETLAQKLADTMTKETAHFGGKNTFSIARVPYALSTEYFIEEKEDVEDEIADLEFRMQDENYVDESLNESINEDQYFEKLKPEIKEIAEGDWEVGHTFDSDDFNEFAHIIISDEPELGKFEDGELELYYPDLLHRLFDYYCDCIDEIRSEEYYNKYDEDDLDESKKSIKDDKQMLVESKKEIVSQFDVDMKYSEASDENKDYFNQLERILGADELYGGNILEIKNIKLYQYPEIYSNGVTVRYEFTFDALVDGDFDRDNDHPEWIRFDTRRMDYGSDYSVSAYYDSDGVPVSESDDAYNVGDGYEVIETLIDYLHNNGYESIDNVDDILCDNVEQPEIETDYDDLDEKLIQGKSDAALKKNIATEIEAGKDPKQAYAIAKSIQKKNMKEDLDNDEIDNFFQSLTDKDEVYFVTEDESGNEGETFDDLQDAIDYVQREETNDIKVVAFANIGGDGFNRKSVTVYEYDNSNESLESNRVVKSIQRKNMKESIDDVDDFPIEEEIWVIDKDEKILDKFNEKDDFLFFHQFTDEEVIEELVDRYGKDIRIERVHFNEDNLPETSETLYDFDEDATIDSAHHNIDIDAKIKDAVENLRDTVKDMPPLEIYKTASNEHLWALGSDTIQKATMHEVNATAYRILAQEKELAQNEI